MSLLRQAERCVANQVAWKHLNAFISVAAADDVLRQAREADETSSSGRGGAPSSSPLHGRLIALKDNICTTDLPTTCGSAILARYTSPFDATVTTRLRAAGAIVAGKTNMDEFGMGSHSRYSHFGGVAQPASSHSSATSTTAPAHQLPPNPTDAALLSAGGSSGGSALAVSTLQAHAALGTDTGGSVRLPASYVGVLGFKPSYGRVSRWGVVAYANSLDTVGVLAPGARVARDVFAALDAWDPRDPTSLSARTRVRLSAMDATREPRVRRGLRIGVPREYNIAELSPAVRRAWARALERLSAAGHAVRPVSLPTTRLALSAYYVLAPAEASSNLAKYDGVRYGSRAAGPDSGSVARTAGGENADAVGDDGDGDILFARTRAAFFGPEVKRRLVLGAYTLSASAMDNYFVQAQRVRRLVAADFDAVFAVANPLTTAARPPVRSGGAPAADDDAKVDVLVCPTAPTPAPRLADVERLRPVDAYTNDVFTVPASLAGLPAASVPVEGEGEGEDSEGKIGMQVIGQFGDDGLVLDVAEVMEGLR
ncbi:amidase signature domain-containing protein [Lineolata rhizophorae]|uniref:Glutamyl-tRNA(Gln) amidotransferase subunit A, mitochondrial n=1 Tax=Lineolata rhizophorae TaxID=578093 RepID=A0A6A6P150_9PEZI|nr:amidase signature domain-containing protein [Lineolata rhizophorae]